MKGFTLVELLISISIFTVITTVAVFSHTEFNGSVLLTNLAYEIALSIRQAQFYGISVKQNSSSNFDSSYGIHIDTNSPTTYTLFEDTAVSTQHVKDSNDVDVQTFSISRGNKISKICIGGSLPCVSARFLDLTFKRPNPDAYIASGNDTDSGAITGSYKSEADICISSPQGTVRKIIVESTGQISVATDDNNMCH